MPAAGLLRTALVLLIGLAAGGGAATFWRAPGADHLAPLGADSAPPSRLDEARVEASLARLPPARRQAVLDDAGLFAAFVEQRGRQQVLAAAATAAGLDELAVVAAELREVTSEVLATRYLEREAPASAVAAPEAAAVEAFYRDQQARFRVPDRLPVWQIFLPASAGDEAGRAEARKRSRQALEDLLSGRKTFAELAASVSAHAPSRLNGGFMGLIAPEELKPEVRQALLNAPQGKPVGPVETADGFHVVQRGALVPGGVPPLAEVRPQIEAWLREQALAARRAEVLAAAAEAHPVNVEAADVEAWRNQLRETAMARDAAAGTQK